jgi:hypothetical protein
MPSKRAAVAAARSCDAASACSIAAMRACEGARAEGGKGEREREDDRG